jgi:hypothetical protein
MLMDHVQALVGICEFVDRRETTASDFTSVPYGGRIWGRCVVVLLLHMYVLVGRSGQGTMMELQKHKRGTHNRPLRTVSPMPVACNNLTTTSVSDPAHGR